MKITILLCTLFAVSLAAERPELYEESRRSRPELYDEEQVLIRPNQLMAPARSFRPMKSEEDRIINGKNAGRGNFPYQISLQARTTNLWGQTYWSHNCGGSILNSRSILTAAHCVDRASVSKTRAVAGDYDLSKSEGSEEAISASSFVIHPSWDPSRLRNDIAIVRLSKAITYNGYRKAVTLHRSKPATGTSVKLTGWGYVDNSQSKPAIMQLLDTVVASTSKASADMSNYWDAATQVATDGVTTGACHGDSGGPLVLASNKEQFGIVSYGNPPCGRDICDYYTRVDAFRSWINNNA